MEINDTTLGIAHFMRLSKNFTDDLVGFYKLLMDDVKKIITQSCNDGDSFEEMISKIEDLF